MVTLEGNEPVGYEPFVYGWLDEEANDAWGRPVDLLEMPDGSLLVSDDRANAIYRVYYNGKERKVKPRVKTYQAFAENQEPAIDKSHPGFALYQMHCQACHQANGQGVQDTHPPIAGSEWVSGDKDRLIDVVINGLEGEIKVKGESYYGVMPPMPYLSNQEVADVLSFVRANFGNNASKVSPQEVRKVRERSDLAQNKSNP